MRLVKNKGFTLIELMIVLLVVAVLASVAIPNYQQYVMRSNRAAAQAAMMDIANRQQQLLLANRSYAEETDPAWINTGYALPSELGDKYAYTITVEPGTAPRFTIEFSPIGTQASDVVLSLNSEGEKSPADKW